MDDKMIKDIRDALYPNYPYLHPRTEIMSSTEWKLVATFGAGCVEWHCHIRHTSDGDGVLFAFKENPEDREALGPYTGDNPRYTLGGTTTPPMTHFRRRTRPVHLFAKLDPNLYVPPIPNPGQARSHGPVVQIEEWRFIDKEGQTDEKVPVEVDKSVRSYMSEIEKEQAAVMKEMR